MLALLLILILFAFSLAYLFYGNFIRKTLDLDDRNPTPAHTVNDGIDYVPARVPVLFGHHFSSIAGAGPVIGPVIVAAAFGWLPALIWIIIGSIFIGGVHDMTAIIFSIRHGGESVARVAHKYISPLAYKIFLLFVWLTLVYIITVFVDLTSVTFIEDGGVATSSIIYIFLAVIFGLLLYRAGLSFRFLTILCVSLAFAGIWAGQLFPITFHPYGFLGISDKTLWASLLIVYCFAASVLPVWLLLQPRDYLSSYLLYGSVLMGFAGILAGGFDFEFPAFTGFHSDYLGYMFPILFVTVACGAVSGFHALVASGTTSKQLNKECDARIVGYGAMLVEGIVAVIALATVIIAATTDPVLKRQPLEIFAAGMGRFFDVFGLPQATGRSFGLLALSAFILTTLDTATRIARYIFQEFFSLKKSFYRFFATAASLVLPLIFIFIEIKDQAGNPLPVWKAVWPVFGASNQLMAALVLLVITIWLKKSGKKYLFTLIPTVFMTVVTVWSLIILLGKYQFSAIGLISFMLLILTILLIVESGRSLDKSR
ncbi:MAG: carbon starvation protein A [Deltaproteobacteria bacterium]|nr:carbon starvation protein A [Deltaproteobacteria bacterium]